jgi:hypothetical protein
MDPFSGLVVDGKVLAQKRPYASLKINPNYFLQLHSFPPSFLSTDRFAASLYRLRIAEG